MINRQFLSVPAKILPGAYSHKLIGHHSLNNIDSVSGLKGTNCSQDSVNCSLGIQKYYP